LPVLTAERIIRLAVDINVFIADILSSRPQGRASASTRIVEAVREGRCPAGPVQFIASLPMIENFANVLLRRLGYGRSEADEKAWLLEQYALDGPMPSHPYVAVASGYIPFETEEQFRRAAENQLRPEHAGKPRPAPRSASCCAPLPLAGDPMTDRDEGFTVSDL
jgi:hypothetical protein